MHLLDKSAQKWDRRFAHSENRIIRNFIEYICEFDDFLPHGKEAWNNEKKREYAVGGYDKVGFVRIC